MQNKSREIYVNFNTVDCNMVVVTAYYKLKQIEEIRERNGSMSRSMSIVSLDDWLDEKIR